MRSALDRDRESGFTLVELLVVIIIIGILAAIAVPIFLNQRQRAFEAETKSDLQRVRTHASDQLLQGRTPTGHAFWVDAFRAAGVWDEIPHQNGGHIIGKTYAVCANAEDFAVGVYNTDTGRATIHHHVTYNSGVMVATVIDPTMPAPNTLGKFCQTVLPGYTYSSWAHDNMKSWEAALPAP